MLLKLFSEKMSDAPLKTSNVLQDLKSLITKFEDDEYPDLWFTDARHPDLEVISDKVVKSPSSDQVRISKKRIQNKKFSLKEEATLLMSSLLKDGEWLCLKCQFRSREKKVILFHIHSFHHNVVLMCSKCPFKTDQSQELILHSVQHKIIQNEPLNGVQKPSINQITNENTQRFSSLASPSTNHGNTVKTRQIGNTKMPSVVFHNAISTTATSQQKRLFYKCKRCNLMFSSISYLQSHMQQSHQIKSVTTKFNCGQCKFYGYKQDDVKNHYFKVHLPKAEQCSFCKSLFRNKMHLADHFKRCKKKTKLDGFQINANPAIENSVIEEVIEKDKSESTGENKLTLTETCSSLLDILGTLEEDSVV